MTKSQERAAFDHRHASEIIEVTVLTGEHTGGAGKAGDEIFWTASAPLLGIIDEDGGTVIGKGRLSWLADEEQRGSWIHDLEPLTQYVVRVRRSAPDPAEYAKHGMPFPDLSRDFALDEVIERDIHVPALDDRLAAWLRPVVLATSVGDLELDRSFGHFSGAIEWCGSEVSIMLDIDDDSIEGAETCTVALGRLEQQVADATEVDARWRSFAADKLFELANDWQEQSDDDAQPAPAPMTAEDFAGRIRLSELSITADGSTTPYYSDDDMFFGHVILIDVEPDGTMTDAYIAG